MAALAAQTIASHAAAKAGASTHADAKGATGLEAIFASLLAAQGDGADAAGDANAKLAATNGVTHPPPQALAAKRIAELLNGSAHLPAPGIKVPDAIAAAAKQNDKTSSGKDQPAPSDDGEAVQQFAAALNGQTKAADGKPTAAKDNDKGKSQDKAAAKTDAAKPDHVKHHKHDKHAGKKDGAPDDGTRPAAQPAHPQTASAAPPVAAPPPPVDSQPAPAARGADGKLAGIGDAKDPPTRAAQAGQPAPAADAPDHDAPSTAGDNDAGKIAAKAAPPTKPASPGAAAPKPSPPQAADHADAPRPEQTATQAGTRAAPNAAPPAGQPASAKAVQETLAALGAAPAKPTPRQAPATEPGKAKADGGKSDKAGKPAKAGAPQPQAARAPAPPSPAKAPPAPAQPPVQGADAKPERHHDGSHTGKAEGVKAGAATPTAIQAPHAAASATAETATAQSATQTLAAPAQSASLPSAPAHIQAQLQVTPQNTPNAVPLSNLGALAINIAAHSRDGAKHFDIALHPQDLGSIHVHLSVDHTGAAQAHLTADNSQTLQLLQRDAQHLERALKDAGLNLAGSGLNFSLKGQQQQQNSSGHSNRGSARGLSVSAIASAEPAVETTNANYNVAPDSARLDIRV